MPKATGDREIYLELFSSDNLPPADGGEATFLPIGAGTSNPDQISRCRKLWRKTSDGSVSVENARPDDPDNCAVPNDFTVVEEKTGIFFDIIRATISTELTDQNDVT